MVGELRIKAQIREILVNMPIRALLLGCSTGRS